MGMGDCQYRRTLVGGWFRQIEAGCHIGTRLNLVSMVI
jgi:hypothetical protein